MVSIVLIILAAICNAVMDKISHHYYRSVFSKRRFNRDWWNPEISWENKYEKYPVTNIININKRKKWMGGIMNYPVQLTDAWHFFKMFQLVFILSAIPLFSSYNLIPNSYFINLLLNILLLGIIYNSTFSLFYKIIFDKNARLF